MASSNSPKDCPICQEEYNEEERCPRSLPCSHTLCSECIGNLIKRNSNKCPFCLREFSATAARDIGVNTALLDMMKLLREMELGTLAPRIGLTAARTHRVNDMKRETEEIINELCNSFQKADEEADRILLSNNQVKNSLLQASDTIEKVLSQNVDRVQYLEEHSRRLQSQKKVIHGRRKAVREIQTRLASSCTFMQIGTVADEFENIKTVAQEKLRIFMEHMFEDEKTLKKLEKVAKATKDRTAHLEKLVKLAGTADEVSYIPDLKSMKVQDCITQVTIEMLRLRSAAVMQLIRQGKIFAVQELEGRRRYAQISHQEKDRIVLHHLTEQIIPSDAHFLKHTDVLKLADASSRMVFLELRHDITVALGKLYIRLFNDSKRAAQFALLCSGEKGPSYLKSYFLSRDSEKVKGGDYENLRGKGGKALVSDVWREEGGVFKRPQEEGILWGRNSSGGEAEAAQFWIYIRNSPGHTLDWCFGKVEEGLSILQDAITDYSDITKLFISDAGLVLNI